MGSEISGKILGATTNSLYFFDNFKTVSVPALIFDVLIVTILFYWLYLFLRETRAIRILYGLFLLLALMTVGRLFNLVLLNWILKYLTTMLVVAIPVVFQPELRAALEKLGHARLLSDLSFSKADQQKAIEDIIQTVMGLSKHRIGALIVLQRQTGLREYIENGTKLNAALSRELLMSIFYPKSPLHDGAAVIAGDRILSARSILPVSAIQIGSDLGTRHRAGIGVTEDSDAIAIVVSEETGIVSIAVGGKLERRIAEDRLRNRLSALLRQNSK